MRETSGATARAITRGPTAVITFQVDRLPADDSEAVYLRRLHWRESGYDDEEEPNPDREQYEALDAAGLLRIYTARIEQALVGYAVFVLYRSLHHRGRLQAMQDVLYVVPQHRGAAAVKLLRYAEHSLRAEGVKWVYHPVKHASKVGKLLGCLGYQLINDLYAKQL